MLKLYDDYTQKQLSNILIELEDIRRHNIFSHIINLIKFSGFHYGLFLKNDKTEIRNLNIQWDERLNPILSYNKKKPKFLLPPDSLDGYLELGMKLEYVDKETETKKVHIYNILWHELFELYLMLDKEMQYKEAHGYVANEEKESFLIQFPLLSEFPAGDLICKA